MPKKKINNRLNKLFENIKSDEPPPQPKRAAKRPFQAARLNPDAVPADLARPRAADAVIASAPASSVKKSDAAVMSLAFQPRENDWATLRILDETTNSRVWSEDDQLLVRQVADQLSLALENAHLFQEQQKQAAKLQDVSEISSAVSTILNQKELLDTFVYLTRQRFNLYHTHIFILEEDNHTLDVKACGWQDESLNGTQETRTIDINQPVSIVARAARTLQPVILNNVRENPAWLPNPYLPDVQSEMAIPIISQEKLLVGVLNIHADQLNAFDDNDSAIMTTLAAQIGVVIQNTRLFQETKERNEQLGALNEIMSSAGQTLEIRSILKTVLEKTLHATSFDGGLITMFNNSRSKLERAVRIGMPGESPADPAEGLDQSLCKHVFDTRQDLVIPNLALGAPVDVSSEVQAGLHGYIGIPLESKGNMLGTLCLFRYANERIPEKAIALCKTIAVQLGFTIDNSRLFELSQASEANFRNLVENAPEAIIVVDMTTDLIADPNENAEHLYGLNRQELVQMGIADLSPELQPDGRPSKEVVLEKLTQALKGGIPIFEWTHKNRQGKMLPCEIHLSRLPGDHPRVRATVIDITERKFSELIRTATTAISDAALVAPDIAGMLKVVHDSVNTLVPAKNFYVSLYDKTSDLLTFPYYVDEFDAPWPPEKFGTGLTSYVIKTGKPLLVTPELSKEIITSPGFQRSGTKSIDWIGVPLKSGQDILGVMAIQTYSQDIRLTEKDRDTLNLLGGQVAIAIDRKRAQESITRSEAELRALFSAMNDVIIVIDRHGRYIRIAPTNPSRLFRPSEEMIGKTVKEILPSYIQEPMMSAIQEAINTGLPVQLEYWLDIRDQTYWFDASLSRLNEDQVFLVAKDITERKKAEESLRRRDEYLAASSEIGRKITSTLELETIFSRAVNLIAERFSLYHTAIYTIEETGFNAVLRDGTGVAGQELKKQKYKLPIKTDTLVGSVMSAGEAVINNNTAKDALYLLSHMSRDAISKPSHLLPKTRSEAGIPLRVGSRVTGVIDLQSDRPDEFHPDDIAVLQTLADQIAIAIDNARSYELSQQAVREMREIDRLKSQFLANMSHELRTPLNSIIGFSRVIIKGIDGPVTELQQQDLTAIYNSGQHLLALINDILDLAKIEAGKMELAFDEVNMNDVINSVLATVTGLIKDKPVTLKKNIAPDMPTVRADAIRIRQVLINLFSNASKFTEEGTITVAASVKVSENSRPEIIVSVTDTGPGIAPEDQAKLFQAFSQVDDSPTRKTGGTGLGLSISQNLIQMHGGRIGVDSVVGKGSTFYFTLPVYRGNLSSNEPQISMGGKTILAIDDDPQVVRLYERYLQPQGYQVIAVTEPGKAKERAIQLKPFAITLDIMMPGIDGWQVLSELKSSPETRNIPVVICSIIEDHEKGFSLGAADYLSKPILEEDLLNALERLNKDNLIEEILVIDDNPNDLKLIGTMLKNQGRYKPNLVEGGVNGWNAITKKVPQAVILDLFMPVLDGFTILENMHANTRLRDIPVIILTAGDLTADQKHQLAQFGPRLIAKSALNEKDLIASIERALSVPPNNREEKHTPVSFIIKCIDCGHTTPYHPISTTCPRCNSQWREAEYDYENLAKTLPGLWANRPFDLWRYRELLPIRNPVLSLNLGEGGTPLVQALNLGMMLGCANLYIKDERQGPTGSFKDRQASVTISALKEAGITEMVAASTGNVAIAYSAFASRAGIKLWAFVTSLVPAVKMREIALYGSQVIKITGSYDQAKQVASEFARQRNLYQDMGARTITSIEAMKTIAYEIVEQLTASMGSVKTSDGRIVMRTPDWYVQAVSGGMGPIGVYKGFRELKQMGLIDKIPALVPIQADGCAPMVTSWKQGLEKAIPVVTPKTRIETLATGDPGRSYTILRERVNETNGVFESVSDEDTFRAMHVLAKMEGISAEPAAGVAFAGLFQLMREGIIKPSDIVVVNCTGHTVPAEQYVLGDNWSRDVVFPTKQEQTPEEGLLSALNQVAPDRFPRIVIVDDTTEARRLIRRILQSQGDFTIMEASNGKEGLELIQREVPDLIVLDLMMPEMDGFAVLDALRANRGTANIPVIVATAKELTPDEKNRLNGHIQSLMQKGDFLNDEFLEEVRLLIK